MPGRSSIQLMARNTCRVKTLCKAILGQPQLNRRRQCISAIMAVTAASETGTVAESHATTPHACRFVLAATEEKTECFVTIEVGSSATSFGQPSYLSAGPREFKEKVLDDVIGSDAGFPRQRQPPFIPPAVCGLPRLRLLFTYIPARLLVKPCILPRPFSCSSPPVP